MTANKPFIRHRLAWLWLLLASLASALDIPPQPPGGRPLVVPNVMYLLDDSGSMMWDVLPDESVYGGYHGFLFPLPDQTYGDGLYYTRANRVGVWNKPDAGNGIQLLVPAFDDDNIYSVYLRSARNNPLFYDPQRTYQPWPDGTGKAYAAVVPWQGANPARAYFNPARPLQGVLDLTRLQSSANGGQGTVHWLSARVDDYSNAAANARVDTRTNASFYPLTFYVYESGDPRQIGSYTRYQYRNGSMYRRRLPAGVESTVSQFAWGGGRTLEQEVANFANWFQYYRSRMLAVKAGSSLAFAELGTGFRVGLATINLRGSSAGELAVPQGGDFSGQNRQRFFDALLGMPLSPRGTPLRGALAWAGNNYQQNYWRDSVSCRRAFTILATDGYWNGDGDIDSGNRFGNADGSYPQPYRDSYANTLADVAMYYWKTDLSALKNTVPPLEGNPQTQQHMTTFGLSLGVRGKLDPARDLAALSPPAATLAWPDPVAANPHKIDDLWHATVNSRGSFVSANDPEQFRKGLVSALSDIASMAGSHAAGGSSSAVYSDGARYYQSGFDSRGWSGNLRSFRLLLSGNSVVAETRPEWEAGAVLAGKASRQILFNTGGTGTVSQPFSLAALQQAGQGAGFSDALVAYLRGSRAGEGSTAPAFRARGSLLGDIVGASPLYVGAPSARLPAQAGRPAMVYVNANDGMLHGFDAASGQERFAYIPSRVLPRLPLLAKQDYAGHHEYFVDGQIEVSEAVNRDDGQVGTFLASSLGRGGPQLFLLNVTDPAAVSEYSSSLALWEFSDAQDRNLGLLHQSPPRIVRLNDGRDYVLAPNGYDSATGSAGLFILPLARPAAWRPGTDYRWLAADNSGNNGLSAITPYDLDGNGSVDLVYAGDLKGNVWKFDLSGSNPASWQVALGGQPLFRARGPSGLPQPITVAPAVARHPQADGVPDATRSGLLVLVGTGRYLASCDQAGATCPGEEGVSSLYGLWDYGGAICQRSELQTQALSTLVLAGNTYRMGSNNTVQYPPAQIVASPCLQAGLPRKDVWTLAANGSIDRRYAFPAFTLPADKRAASAGYWLGWYLDLPQAAERVVSYMAVLRRRLEVQTFIPAGSSSDVCEQGKDEGYLLRLDMVTGGAFVRPRFDDPVLAKAIATGVSGSRQVVGKKTAGSLGRVVLRKGTRLSTVLALTDGGIGGGVDEAWGRKVSRVSWREIIKP